MAGLERTMPPFRAEHAGSLLRPAALRRAYRDFSDRKLDQAAFAHAQDESVREVVQFQESLGFKLVTDGEFRRASYWSHFIEAVEGFTVKPSPFRFGDTAGRESEFLAPYVVARVGRRRSFSAAEFAYLKSVAKVTVKITVPSAPTMHFYAGRRGVARDAYATDEVYFADLARVYRNELAELAALGCTYVQIDEVPLAMLCDNRIRTQVRAEGWDPDSLVDRYIALLNECLVGRPAGMTVGLHLCRGNFKGTWLSEGGYNYVAEKMFAGVHVDAFFLEYDTPRAGDFTPLAAVPSNKFVVLGLISTKTPVLENADHLRRRIDEAARFVPLDRLALSPQCGFASTAAGNPIAPDDQKKKLTLVVETARKVWG